MSNLRSTAHLPLKTPMTNKWKSQAPNSEILERQTRALEESLNKLKLAIHPEKAKPSADANASIWDKGKSGPMTQYANHILREDPTRTFDANKPTKIRVLGDEPPATVVRPSLVASLFSSKGPAPANLTQKCGQCEKEEAKMRCLECAELYCAGCFAHFHLRGALQRHRCVPLGESRPSTPQKKKTTVGADVIFKELRVAQSKEDLLRNSTMTVAEEEEFDEEDEDEPRGGELLKGKYDEKSSAAAFQQALLQWRQGAPTKKVPTAPSTGRKSTHEMASDTTYDSNGHKNSIPMPKIEFHSSSKLSYGEKLLLKKYRRANGTTSSSSSNADRQMNLDIEPLYEDLPTDRTLNGETKEFEDLASDRTIRAEDLQEKKIEVRPKSRSSRPNSAAKRLNSARSRPPSAALFQQPLPSLLAANPNDDLKAVVATEPTSSRPSSAALKRPTKIESRLPTMWNRNWKPEQSVSDGIDPRTIQIDQASIGKFDSVLEDLLDENKIELASRSENPPTPIVSPIKSARKESPIPLAPPPPPAPLRQSLFTFADSLRPTDSASSAETGEGGFFTDMPSRPAIAPLKASNILVDDNSSRPGSSVSSASLPVSIISSQPDLITHPSISRHPKAVLAPKKFRVEYAKKPSAPTMVVEGKKVTSARDTDEHPRTKISSGVAPRSSYQSQHLMKTSSTSSITTVTRDDNPLKNESLTLSNSARQSKNKARKIEFSMREGPKWQQGSTSLNASVARPSTPSNPNNNKIANQFSSYDNDDGRSSRACQDVEDEECFNQLREELTSELGTASPGWNASLSEHVLKNLRATEVIMTDKDLQENLNMLENKLRESEILQQSHADDDDMSVHEEIRKL